MARIETELLVDSGRAILTLGGALDVSNAHRLGAMLRRLVREGCHDIVVDLATLATVDAAGVGILRGTASALSAANGSFSFRNAPESLAAYLREHGLRETDDIDAERAAVAPRQRPGAVDLAR